MMRRLWSFLTYAPIGIVVHDNVATVHLETSDEMAPAVPRNTICVLTRDANASRIRRGEIVGVLRPDGRMTLRRVVALPGDYVRELSTMVVVPRGFVWLQSDGRERIAHDSTGKTAVAMVVGRVRAALGGNITPTASANAFKGGMAYE